MQYRWAKVKGGIYFVHCEPGRLSKVVDVCSLQDKRLEKIAALRTKGALTTDAQFRLVYGRHEHIWADPAYEQEAT